LAAVSAKPVKKCDEANLVDKDCGNAYEKETPKLHIVNLFLIVKYGSAAQIEAEEVRFLS
jgi:hypothetical protein